MRYCARELCLDFIEFTCKEKKKVGQAVNITCIHGKSITVETIYM